MSVYKQTKANFLAECQKSIAIAVCRNRDNIIGRLCLRRMFAEMCVFRRGRERSPMTICRYSLAYPFILVHCIHTRRVIRPSQCGRNIICALILGICRIVARCRVGRSGVLQLKDILDTLTVLTVCKHRDRFLVEHIVFAVVESKSNHLVASRNVNGCSESNGSSNILALAVFQCHSRRKGGKLVSLIVRRCCIDITAYGINCRVSVLINNDTVRRRNQLIHYGISRFQDGKLSSILVVSSCISAHNRDVHLRNLSEGIGSKIIRINGNHLCLAFNAHRSFQSCYL